MSASKRNSGKIEDKKTLTVVHLLHPYVKQRIRVGENLGIFPKNMYQSNEVIDEVVVEVYQAEEHKNNDLDDLRRIMFDHVNRKLNSLFEAESFHKDSISTKEFLNDELKQLEENFTMDADNDLVMNEDLDDISYHQNKSFVSSLPYDQAQEGIHSFLELTYEQEVNNWDNRKSLRKVYYTLPLKASNVVDLYVLGKLSFQEIASILKIEISEVKEIVNFVKETFKKELE